MAGIRRDLRGRPGDRHRHQLSRPRRIERKQPRIEEKHVRAREDHPGRRRPHRPRRADHPVHRGRRHRRRHLAGRAARARRRGEEARQDDRVEGGARRARRRSTRPATGCPTRPSPRSASTSSGSRARSPRRSAAASARSTSRCARSSTSTCACARCAGSPGVPSPVKHPEKVDMVIFRENTEDIYAGLEVEEGTPEAKKLIELLKDEFGWDIRPDSGIGIKPISETGSKRLIRAVDRVRGEAQPQERDARAQGQHPEVHRRRVPQLGLRARRARSSPTSPSAGTTAAASPATRSS